MLTSVEQLEAIYGAPSERALWKEIPYLNEDYRVFVEASPFIVLASVGPHGTDCSPKGDAPGFVKIVDERTLAIPDRPGNNRIDNLRNIVADGRVSVLFMVPGVGETLRVNGRATVTDDAALLESFAVDGKLPRTAIIVHIDTAYFHCSKAIARSHLWKPERQVERSTLPSAGQMHKRLCNREFDAEAYDKDSAERLPSMLY
ncbi:pyridoxamine 5'-phosphate oxidase family protein [Trinickia terrae]|uniref:Pyridoxamine 5'-phosphate oxidase family protein n=1 Tax=Trinickia terrae TaxID=2571161 RepID=A0A4U1HWY4_9BURK|nr:pyridoxamine 5'-phosphate oxidase family protein [Trinickia terrae]TKC86225.1 pyridoxamine 5'-phosphate oxidase family protein [Trinickia terrae]